MGLGGCNDRLFSASVEREGPGLLPHGKQDQSGTQDEGKAA